jgi:regulatory protein
MKITDIKQQQKRQGRFSIYADGKYVFSLSDWQLAKSGIRIGLEFDKKDLDKLKTDSEFGKIYDRTLMWLGLRPRSEWEIDEYLRRKTDQVEVRDEIKQKIADINQIDDQRFAESWVASRRSLKNVSRYRLTQELRQKRIDQSIIDRVLTQDETTDIETLKKLVAKKSAQSRYKDEDKLIAYLARQGFRYDDIKQAISQLAE